MPQTTRYFTNCATLDALKCERNRLAKLHHPDLGGSVETMQEINAQYEQAKRQLAAPAAQRVWSCPKPQPQESVYEQMMRWARQKQDERLERERQAYRDEVAKQRDRQRQEFDWAWEQIYKAYYQGLLRHCPCQGDKGRTYLYVSGNTYPYRQWLKEHGFRWDAGNRRWYFYKKPTIDPDEEDYFDDNYE